MLSTKTLAELVRRKHGVLVQLCDIGRRQQHIVEEGETGTLLQLLSAKQTLISAVQQLEREMAPYRTEAPEARIWPNGEERARCAQQAEECNQLLEQIVALERYSADRMTARRNEVAAQLQHVYSAGQARDAYAAHRNRG
jgi:flagellar biosynthesis/type III secretory pathway chaperone